MLKRLLIISLLCLLPWAHAIAATWQLNQNESSIILEHGGANNQQQQEIFNKITTSTQTGSISFSAKLEDVANKLDDNSNAILGALLSDYSNEEITVEIFTNINNLADVPVGETRTEEAFGIITLADIAQGMQLELAITKISDTELKIVNSKPIIISMLSLPQGTPQEQHQQYLDIKALTLQVPVTISLVFEKQYSTES